MDAIKNQVLQKRAEGIIKSALKPLLVIQTLNGSNALAKIQESSAIRFILAIYSTVAMSYFLFGTIVKGIPEAFNLLPMSFATGQVVERTLAMLCNFIITIESFQGSRFNTVLNAILNVNSVIKSIERSECNIIIFSCICTLLLICDQSFAMYQTYYFNYGQTTWWTYNLMVLMLCLVKSEVVVCVVLVRIIAIHFDQLSRDLQKMVAVSNNDLKPVYVLDFMPGNISSSKLKQIYKTYDMIVQAVERIQDFFAIKILISTIVTFLYQITVLQAYIIQDKIIDYSKITHSWLLIVINVYNFVRYLIPMAMLCFYCERLYSYVDRIKESLVNIIAYNNNREIQRVCCLMLEIIRVQPLELMVLRLFRVDLRLVPRYLTFLATYIIVVLQFSY